MKSLKKEELVEVVKKLNDSVKEEFFGILKNLVPTEEETKPNMKVVMKGNYRSPTDSVPYLVEEMALSIVEEDNLDQWTIVEENDTEWLLSKCVINGESTVIIAKVFDYVQSV